MEALQLVLVLLSALVDVSSAGRVCLGDIHNLTPTGRLKGGVAASNKAIDQDRGDLNKYRVCYEQSADKYCLQAAVIAAIASRESRGGRVLIPTGGYGDHGKAWGIMQCDLRHSGLPCMDCPWNSCCHIDMMVGRMLVPFIKQVEKKKASWSLAQQLQGGVAAYNFGVRNVQTWANLDVNTTDNDYSNDVIARAQHLQNKYGWN